MKIIFFSVREDEKELLLHFSHKYNISPTIYSIPLSVDTVHLIEGHDGISIITTKVDALLVQKIKEHHVSYLSTRTVGYDHIDIEACKKHDIHVSNVTYTSNTVAEYTLMMMLMGVRKMSSIIQRYQAQDFSLHTMRGKQLKGLTIGIIGTGKIGKTVIYLLEPFQCTILAYDAFIDHSLDQKVTYCSLEELYERSDLITLHAPNTSDSYHMINKTAISHMKDGVIIVNTARGSLIDTSALIQGILSKKIGFACLDVLEDESLIYYRDFKNKIINHADMSILRSFPNVLLTPHTAFYSDEAVSDMIENSIQSLCLMKENKENPWVIK